MLGKIELENFSPCKLPQKAQSAFDAVTSGLVGASYKPLLYLGKQPVKGVNHILIVEQTLITREPVRRIVKMAINEFQGNFTLVKPIQVLA